MTSTDARLEEAFRLVADPSLSVLSLDVFDTLIWRKVADPVDAFFVVGERLRAEQLAVDHIGPAVFQRLRAAAEGRAREHARAEVTLAEIYAKLPGWVLAPGATREQLAAVELEVERSLILPDLDVLALVQAARTHGKRVVAVSDTYLSEADLRFILSPTYADAGEIERIFTSSDHRDGKAGGLFKTVLADLGAEPGAVVHVGDHPQSDVAAPRRLGIRAVYFERRPERLARSLERERRYVAAPIVPAQGDFGLTAARSKVLHRCESRDLADGLRGFWEYGAASLGPAFTGFAEWVVERAQQRAAGRVFCLMREGELLSRLIGTASAYMGADVTAEPIWLSRQLCSRAAIQDCTPSELAGLLQRRQRPTVRELCRTLEVDVELVPALRKSAELRLTDERLAEQVLRTLAYDPELRTQILASAHALRERLVDYVRSRIGPDERRVLLVDLGWGATIQSMLARVLRAAEIEIDTVGLYLITQPFVTERMLDGFETEGFLAHLGMPAAATQAILRSPEILEQVCMPDVGPQVGLTADLEPILDDATDADTVQADERHAIQQGIVAFQRERGRYRTELRERVPPLSAGAQELLLASLARALVAPTQSEALMLAGWVHDENFGSAAAEPIVNRRAARAARYFDAATLLDVPMTELYWLYGFAVLQDDGLAESTEAVAMGLLSPGATSSVVETGSVELLCDHGMGFWQGSRISVLPRRNRFGLTLVRRRLEGDAIRRVRIDVAKAPAVIRIDWAAFRCHLRGRSDPVEVRLERAEELDRLSPRRFTQIRPKLFLVGAGSQLTFDIVAATEGEAIAVDVELAYAAMPVAQPRGADRVAEARWQARATLQASKRIVLRLEDRTGLPVGDPLRRMWWRLRAR
jgi:FMN phosphatase YigB (HAD superfamily)